jgi:hypothetical protein
MTCTGKLLHVTRMTNCNGRYRAYNVYVQSHLSCPPGYFRHIQHIETLSVLDGNIEGRSPFHPITYHASRLCVKTAPVRRRKLNFNSLICAPQNRVTLKRLYVHPEREHYDQALAGSRNTIRQYHRREARAGVKAFGTNRPESLSTRNASAGIPTCSKLNVEKFDARAAKYSGVGSRSARRIHRWLPVLPSAV